MEKRRALGRGLQALIPEVEQEKEAIVYLNVAEIKPGRYQPREDFNQEKQNELKASIKEKGVVQPVLARRTEGGFELIAGERRLRVVKELGIEKIPAIIKDVDDAEAMELGLIENIQREELNPIEEAHAYKRLVDEFGFTQEKISQTISKDRSSVANILRLLNLPLKIQRYISQGLITMGHARALLSVKSLQRQLSLCERIIKKGLSVREAEILVAPKIKAKKTGFTPKDHHILSLEEKLQNLLRTKVRIYHGKKRGKITVEYYSTDDLNRIINVITGTRGR